MNSSNWAKYFLGWWIITAILFILAYGLIKGFQEMSFIEGLVTGTLAPILTLVVQFFFRRAGSKEK